jgi:hypothetical protein
MNARLKLATALAAVHLVLVACGVLGLSIVPHDSVAGAALNTYGVLSGSDNNYGFFAPGVALQMQAEFALSDGAGRVWTDRLETGANNEVAKRIDSCVSRSADPELSPALAASWAAVMFDRHPDAQRVVVRVREYALPTMAEFQAGQRPEWRPVFEVTFERNLQLATVTR